MQTNRTILMPVVLNDAQQDCLDKLREAVAEAEKGNIYAIGLVACMKTGYATVIGGTRAGDVNLGCDSLKRRILDGVEGAAQPTILRGRA